VPPVVGEPKESYSLVAVRSALSVSRIVGWTFHVSKFSGLCLDLFLAEDLRGKLVDLTP